MTETTNLLPDREVGKRAYNRAYYAAHKEELRAKNKAWRLAHKAELAIKGFLYRENHKEERRRNMAAYAASHKEERRAYKVAHKGEVLARERLFRQTHKDVERYKNPERRRLRHREYTARYRAKNLEASRAKARIREAARLAANPESRIHARARSAAWRVAHPEAPRQWLRAHPEKNALYHARRRATKANAAINDFTDIQWEAMKQHYGSRCAYCGRKMRRLTQDHITPLSKGGNHTLSNIVPACRSCNSKKYTGAPLIPVQPLLLVED